MNSTVNPAPNVTPSAVDATLAEWTRSMQTTVRGGLPWTLLECAVKELPKICSRLFTTLEYSFATLVVEEAESEWHLHYLFYGERQRGVVEVAIQVPLAQTTIPTISAAVHAADWHEREAEDLFGLVFEGHPRLGDFVLHEQWPEGVNPMRAGFDAATGYPQREPDPAWLPMKIVEAPGSFAMPIGPVFSDYAESAHFQLETVGEDVIRVVPRFFYKYRGIEKLAERRRIEEALLLAERFSGTSAVAHGLAFCQAVEAVCQLAIPPRAQALRVLLTELERCRHHVGAITEICGSTGLAVATSQAAILEEELLRLSCQYVGHRYLFGMNVPGGLSLDLSDAACCELSEALRGIVSRLRELQEMLRFSSSFLDRIEEVGMISTEHATDYGLVGPIARASGVVRDLRTVLPYGFFAQQELTFTVPSEQEGDGYARLRILFSEVEQSARLIEQLARSLPPGQVRCRPFAVSAGTGCGWVEAPRGAAFHWLRLGEDERVARYRVSAPSFANWHGFHLAAENFAFQDFPIIMATFGLSNAECDR